LKKKSIRKWRSTAKDTKSTAKDTKYPWVVKSGDKFGYTQASIEGWYSSRKWLKVRDYKLLQDPLCEHCLIKGSYTKAAVVDHIEPIKGTTDKDLDLFFEMSNLQSLCDYHHRVKTVRDNSKYSKANLEKGKQLMNKFES